MYAQMGSCASSGKLIQQWEFQTEIRDPKSASMYLTMFDYNGDYSYGGDWLHRLPRNWQCYIRHSLLCEIYHQYENLIKFHADKNYSILICVKAKSIHVYFGKHSLVKKDLYLVPIRPPKFDLVVVDKNDYMYVIEMPGTRQQFKQSFWMPYKSNIQELEFLWKTRCDFTNSKDHAEFHKEEYESNESNQTVDIQKQKLVQFADVLSKQISTPVVDKVCTSQTLFKVLHAINMYTLEQCLKVNNNTASLVYLYRVWGNHIYKYNLDIDDIDSKINENKDESDVVLKRMHILRYILSEIHKNIESKSIKTNSVDITQAKEYFKKIACVMEIVYAVLYNKPSIQQWL